MVLAENAGIRTRPDSLLPLLHRRGHTCHPGNWGSAVNEPILHLFFTAGSFGCDLDEKEARS